MDKEGEAGELQHGCIHNKIWREIRLMDNKDKKDKEKVDALMKQVQEEQMRLHPEIYEPKKKEDDE